jgi:hypothetical protein
MGLLLINKVMGGDSRGNSTFDKANSLSNHDLIPVIEEQNLLGRRRLFSISTK